MINVRGTVVSFTGNWQKYFFTLVIVSLCSYESFKSVVVNDVKHIYRI